MATKTNLQKLEYAEKNLKITQRKIKRLMTAQYNWQCRVEYYTLKCRQEVAEAKAKQMAEKILQEKAEKEERDAKAFVDALNQQEGRMFRHD